MRLVRRLLMALSGIAVMSCVAVALISCAVICSYGNGTFILSALVVVNSALTAGCVVWCTHCEHVARREDILDSIHHLPRKRKDEALRTRNRGVATDKPGSGG